MNEKYDLHVHSTASDGTLTPTELVRLAAKSEIRTLALTDHDTTAGVEEASREAQLWGINLIPGVEISTTWNNRGVHIIGLGIDLDCTALQCGLESIRAYRLWRAEEIGRRLEQAGIPGAFAEARRIAGGTVIARPHFASFLVDRGIAPNMQSVFKRYLVRGKPGYVSSRWAGFNEAIEWIKTAGGTAVIAHPARYSLSRTQLRRLLGDFVAAGGEALEVVSGTHNKDEIQTIAFHAAYFGLFASVGSDYHGPGHCRPVLGCLPDLPEAVIPIWEKWSETPPLKVANRVL